MEKKLIYNVRPQFTVIKNNHKMTNTILILLVLFSGVNAVAQKENETAEYNIEVNNQTKTIYILGGIASVITKEDLAFAKKYNIQYHDFGCIVPEDIEKYEKLNAQVFNQLDTDFGINWQKEIKKNSLGFEKWKKK